MASERFLVTGSSGCIGAWVLHELLHEGASVVGFDLDPTPRRLAELDPGAAGRATLASGDVASADDLGRAIDAHEITHLIHLAALQIPFCREDPVRGAQVNVVGTVNVFQRAAERTGQVASVVYASSAALYGPDDADVDESGRGASPVTHYGVYKQANEGTARIYWQDAGVSSIGLRPYCVYGPGRDQGVTSAPTFAMHAAARGEAHHVPFGGTAIYNYTRDVARMTIAASRARVDGAHVFNTPGTVAHMRDVVGAIEAAVPEAAGAITFDDVPLPLPSVLPADGLERVVGSVEVTPLAEAVAATIEHFRRAA
jgi:nucleoside-diphosphate-sugar epimerase